MKVKVKNGDQVLEVEHTELELPEAHHLAIFEEGKAPEGFVASTFMQEELQRRTAGRVKKEDLLEDADFWKQVAKKRGIKLDEKGNPIPVKVKEDVDLGALHSQWAEEKLNPVLTENQTLKETATKILSNANRKALLAAAAEVGIKKSFRTSPSQGYSSPVEATFERLFRYDPETDDFAEVEKVEDGKPVFKYGSNPQERRYAGHKDFFERLRRNSDFADWFEDPAAQQGSGFNNNGGRGAQTMRREQFEKLTPADSHKFITGGGQVVD